MSEIHNLLWVEKYRPKKIEDAVLPPELSSVFENMVRDKTLQNMTFSGNCGVGKTTVARILCEQLGIDSMLINASEDNSIETLRNKIRKFASLNSFNLGDGPDIKCVILDEADHLPQHTVQAALRGFIEEFHSTTRFILTCNYVNRIIEPLQSRCPVIDFNMKKSVKADLCRKFFTRLKTILDEEGVEYQDKPLSELIVKHAPDWRRVISDCQRFAKTYGSIDERIQSLISADSVNEIFAFLKEKDFKSMRKWAGENSSLDTTVIMRTVYDRISEFAKPACVPQIVLVVADYMYKNAFVADKEVNLVAFLTEVMANADFK